MRLASFLGVVVALGCATSCRAPGFSRTPPAPEMPSQIGPFRLVSVDTVGGAPRDSIYRYADSAGTTRVSVIRYDVPEDDRVDADTAQWLVREGGKFEVIHPLLVEQGVLEQFEMAFAKLDTVRFGATGVPEFAAAAAIRMRGRRYADLQYLYLVAGKFTKVRATVADETARSKVPLFARELAWRLTGQ